MRRLSIWMVCAAAVAQQDDRAATAAFVEMGCPRTSWYVHEIVPITIRIGYDPAFFKESVLQTTRQDLDVRVQVQAAFLDGLPGTTPITDDERVPGGVATLALNGARAEGRRGADRATGGRAYATVDVVRRLALDLPGRVVVPGARATFACATAFDEDLALGRIPRDRREVSVAASELVLDVLPLPEEGRPPGFSGAVGRFTIQARAEPRELAVGESLKLELAIAGFGNLPSFSPPRLDALRGFRALGMIERPGGRERRLVFDLVPVSDDVTEVPAVDFTFFEPHPQPRYRTIRTTPIPLTVRAAPEGALQAAAPEPAPAAVPGKDDIFDLEPAGAALAERHYRAGRFLEASALFEAALSTGVGAADTLHYDLGNCAYRMGDHARAILHYRQALRRAPRHRAALANLALAEHQLGLEPTPSSAVESFTPRELGIAGALVTLAAVAGFVALRRRRWRVACCAVALGGLVLAGLAVRAHVAPPRQGVVLVPDAPLRADPHAEATVAMRLRAGELVTIDESSERWARVTAGRRSGWAERSALGLVE
jgi:tetratricopeptide (TPR) repeat protein